MGSRRKHLRKFSYAFLRNPKYIILTLPMTKYDRDCTKTRDILCLITVTSYRYLFLPPCAAFVGIILAQPLRDTTSTTHAAACGGASLAQFLLFPSYLVTCLPKTCLQCMAFYLAYDKPTNTLNAVRTTACGRRVNNSGGSKWLGGSIVVDG